MVDPGVDPRIYTAFLVTGENWHHGRTKELFFNLRKLKGQIEAFEEGDLTPEHTTEIAERLNVSEAEVTSMNRRLAGTDHSLNAPLRAETDGEWIDWLADDSESQEFQLAESEEYSMRQGMLQDALQILNERERHILTERRLQEDPTTLEELSKVYGISRERVRQIEVRAFEKLQKAIRNAAIKNNMATGRNVTALLGRCALFLRFVFCLGYAPSFTKRSALRCTTHRLLEYLRRNFF